MTEPLKFKIKEETAITVAQFFALINQMDTLPRPNDDFPNDTEQGVYTFRSSKIKGRLFDITFHFAPAGPDGKLFEVSLAPE